MHKPKIFETRWTYILIVSVYIGIIDANNKKTICYVNNNSINQNSNNELQFNLNKIDVNLCSHLIYSFAVIHNETVLPSNKVLDIELGGYLNFTQLKLKNSQLKTIISIREENSFSKFSNFLRNTKTRQNLNNNIIKFLKEYKFDGIDFIWRYLGSESELEYKCDKKNYLKFLKELKKAFKDDGNNTQHNLFSISIGIPYDINEAKQYYDLARLDQYVDWFNVMKYDSTDLLRIGRNNSKTFEDPIDYYLRAGVFRNKIVLGISTYGLLFIMEPVNQINYTDKIFLEDSPITVLELAKKVETLSYFQICKTIKNSSEWKVYVEEKNFKRVFAINKKEVIVFKDIRMIREDVERVIDLNLGGISLWTIDQDDFNGVCIDKPYPLLEAAKKVLLKKSDSTKSILDSNVSPTAFSTISPISTTTTHAIKSNNSYDVEQSSKRNFISTRINDIRDRIVCYTTNWSVYRTGIGKFAQRLINPNLCSHVIYAYGRIYENDTFLPSDPDSDLTLGGYTELNQLKQINSNFKTLIGVRDYSKNRTLFPTIVASRDRRQKLIESIVDFLNKYNFDGIDIQWRNSAENERQNFVKFIEEIAEKFDKELENRAKPRFLMSIELPAKREEMNGFIVSELNKFVDWFNALTYNYHSVSENQVNHASALFPLPEMPLDELNVDFTINEYLNSGADRNKLVITIPTYGHLFTLSDTSQTNFGSPALDVENLGVITRTRGRLAFYEICEFLFKDIDWKVFQPYPKLIGPYVVKDNQWISFDDENMIKTKADYVADNGLGGIAFWSVDQDDFRGNCGSEPFILVRTARERLEEKLGISNLMVSAEAKITETTEIAVSNTIASTTTMKPVTLINITQPILTSEEKKIVNQTLNIQSSAIDNEERTNNRIICYSPNWSRYRPQFAKFDSSFIMPDLCTHIIYAFAKIENDKILPTDPFADIDQKGYEKFNRIKRANSQLATLISLSTKEEFSDLVNDKEKRTSFIENVLVFLKMYNFNGIDIDWQYPGANPNDKENFVQLLEEMNIRFELDALTLQYSKFLISITIPWQEMYIRNGYDISRLNELVNWFNLLSYNYHRPNERFVNHHAPLYALEGISGTENNINSTVFNYINAGIRRSKLVVGIPTYGISFTLANENETNINSLAVGPGMKGELSGLEGVLPYYEICQKFSSDSDLIWNIRQVEPRVMGPYAFSGTRWVAYDDEEMVRTKANYVADNGLGGVMFWSLDQDDFRGICGDRQPNILIQTAKRALLEKTSSPSSSLILTNSAGLSMSNLDVPIEATTESLKSFIFDCPDIGFFSNAKDCKTYYACFGNSESDEGIMSYLLLCPHGTYFENSIQDCTFLENDKQCTGEDRQINLEIPNREGITENTASVKPLEYSVNISEIITTTTHSPLIKFEKHNSNKNNNIDIKNNTKTASPMMNINNASPLQNNIITPNLKDTLEQKNRIVCYSTNWSRYRPQFAKFDSSFIIPDLCTHLIYAFAKIKNDEVVPTDPFADIDQKGYEKFNRLKKANPQLLTLISITAREEFGDIVNNEDKRKTFVDNLLDFLKMHDFDGVDIDWQYPGRNLNDKENFVKLLQDINYKFDLNAIDPQNLEGYRLLITITIPWQDVHINNGYDIPLLNGLVDWFNLLSYNYHKSHEIYVNHHAPLYALEGVSGTEENVNSTVFNYINAGIQRSKLVVGVPTYGISFTLANENQTNINSPAIGPGAKGELSGLKGVLPYYEICQKISSVSDSAWNIRQVEPKVMGPYAFRGTRWVAYDDEEMVRIKANYVADNGLGGLMFWSLDQDDFRGICGDRQPNILIQTGKRALLEKISISESILLTNPLDFSMKKTEKTILTSTERSESLDFECPDIGFFPNFKDCKTYYACFDNSESEEGIIPYLLSCVNGAYFDNITQDCQFIDTDEQCLEQGEKINPSTYISSTENAPQISFVNKKPTVPSFIPNSNKDQTIFNAASNENIANELIKNISTSDRLWQLIQGFGGIEKVEGLLKRFTLSVNNGSPLIPYSDALSTTTGSPVIFSDNIKKSKVTSHISVDGSSTDAVKSELLLEKGQNNANKITSSSDHIYQIKELHIHNYGVPITDNKDLNKVLKTDTAKQPLILFAPIQVINKVDS